MVCHQQWHHACQSPSDCEHRKPPVNHPLCLSRWDAWSTWDCPGYTGIVGHSWQICGKHNTADPSPESKWTHAYSTMRLYVSIRRSAEEIINCINGSDYIYLLNIIWHVNLTHVICKSEVVSPKHHGTSEHLRIRSWWGCGTSNHLAAAIWGIGEQEDPHNCNSSNSNYVCIYICTYTCRMGPPR